MQDQKVSWHVTSFEERLEKALSEEGGQGFTPSRYILLLLLMKVVSSNRWCINLLLCRKLEIMEEAESDTAIPQLHHPAQSTSIVSFWTSCSLLLSIETVLGAFVQNDYHEFMTHEQYVMIRRRIYIANFTRRFMISYILSITSPDSICSVIHCKSWMIGYQVLDVLSSYIFHYLLILSTIYTLS